MVSAGSHHNLPVPRKWILFLKEPLVAGLAISLAIHLLAYGGWKVGQRYQLIPADLIPRLLQKLQAMAMPPKPAARKMQEVRVPELMFVDVSPDQFSAEPPKDAKYYGAVSTKAANPDPKLDTDTPKIDGKQDKVLKTSEPAKLQPKPLQPTPKPEPERQDKQLTDSAPKPKREVLQGDLALARPTPGVKKGDEKTDPNQRETGNEGLSQRPRPRKLSEVTGRPTDRIKQDGGVRRLSMSSSLDVKGSIIGQYDAEFIAAVEARWFQLIDQQNLRDGGKVVVNFRLHPDGRISNTSVPETTVKGLIAQLICRSAIEEPAPYKKWPAEMRRELNADFRDITFTFFYMSP